MVLPRLYRRVRVRCLCFVYTCRRLIDLSNDCRYPKAFPSALSLVNTSGAKQSTFPNAHRWPADVSEAVLETWVNGWFTTFWQLKSWDNDPTSARVVLGKGGFHGGQPHMLDGIGPDGSVGGPDEFLPEAKQAHKHPPPGFCGDL